MKTHLANLATHNGSGGNSVALAVNPEIPEKYYILPTDSPERRKQKREHYRVWCYRRHIEFVPLPGMPPLRIYDKAKTASKDDPIPEKYYILPTDDKMARDRKRHAYRFWCSYRGIECKPLPCNYPLPHDTKPKTQAEKPQKPRWHDTCTTYQAAEKRLAELVKMRDNCHEHNQWQALQSEINALRCKLLSWCNEKGDKHFSIAMIEPQPFC